MSLSMQSQPAGSKFVTELMLVVIAFHTWREGIPVQFDMPDNGTFSHEMFQT